MKRLKKTLPKLGDMTQKFLCLLTLLLYSSANGQPTLALLKKQHAVYEKALAALRQQHHAQRQLPAVDFYLFGMGDRKKMVYKKGLLLDAVNGDTVRKWNVKKDQIFPSAYTVYLETTGGKRVVINENERGVFLNEGNKTSTLSRSEISLPDFKGFGLAPVLKVLHHEILINIIEGKPVPNFFVYQKPWFRDATLMAMVLQKTNNLHLIRDWVMGIRDPFDRNNHGISEADNLGQVLYLVSLVSDKTHPVVKTVLDSMKQFSRTGPDGIFIEGKTDYASHPVFQTKWLKFGLHSLGIEDSFIIPNVYDSYSSLFWWAYRQQHVAGARFNESNSINYPYLVWAEDHFFNEQKGIVGDRLYPLSWEANASDADYKGNKIIDETLEKFKICMPHTWHAAEMFLILYEHHGSN